jgi:hypothetical protein
MAAQRCETLSGFDWDVVVVTQGSRYAALRGNPGLPYASPSGYFMYRNFLRANARKADDLSRGVNACRFGVTGHGTRRVPTTVTLSRGIPPLSHPKAATRC